MPEKTPQVETALGTDDAGTVAVLAYRPGASPGDAHDLTFIRTITTEDSLGLVAAEELLVRMTLASGVAAVQRATQYLNEEITRLEKLAAEGLRPPELNDYRLQREFKAWLSEFRSLDDRTSAWLSGRFGQQSDVYQRFKALLSTEFDNNFAYRLCCALRNVSEHRADVINAARLDVSVAAEPGKPQRRVRLQIDGSKLVAESGTKMRAATRDELSGTLGLLEVEGLVRATLMSCEHVHMGLFDLLWDPIHEAISLFEGFQEEAEANGGTLAVFIPAEDLQDMERQHRQAEVTLEASDNEEAEISGRFELRQVPMHYVLKAKEVAASVKRVLAEPGPESVPEDFIRG